MIMAYGRVPLETRKVPLGHKTGDITSHYNALELAELIRATKRRTQGAGVHVRVSRSRPASDEAYSANITIVVLPVSGIEPPLCPDATATYCLPFTS
jgi:hypothetical protein